MDSYTVVRARRLPVMIVTAGMLSAAIVLASSNQAQAAAGPVPLGTAASVAVLAYSTITNTGPSIINGDIALSPGTAVTGFPPGTQPSGAAYIGDPVALGVRADASNAYTVAANQVPPLAVPVDLVGQNLVPDIYASGGVLELSGTLTLNGTADPTGIYIFKSTATLTTATASTVVLNGVDPCNVFWVVPSSAIFGTNSVFVGTVLASDSITMLTGAALTGRLLALNGAVALDSNVISTPIGCSPLLNLGGTTITAASTATAAAVAAAAALLAPTGVETELSLWLACAAVLVGSIMVLSTRNRRLGRVTLTQVLLTGFYIGANRNGTLLR